MRPVLVLLLVASACADTDPPCTDTHRPIVFVHGLLAAGDTWANAEMRFEANGFCRERMFAFDWQSLGGRGLGGGVAEDELDAFIDEVRAATGAATVDLAGHSAGGGVGYRYLATAAHAAKVSHYAHVASFRNAAPAGPDAKVPTLNLWSAADAIISEKGEIPGATNVDLATTDHFATATSAESFAAIHRFFTDGEAPSTTALVPTERIRLRGRALELGENTPEAGAKIAIWKVDPKTGDRSGGEPAAALVADAKGWWGPFTAEKDAHYEFVVQSADSAKQLVHYYREPAVRSNPWVYLRTMPPAQSVSGGVLSGVRYDDAHATAIAFLANRAVHAGSDTLTANGTELATVERAGPGRTLIATFLFDDGDGRTEGTTHKGFDALPFLGGVDVFLPTAPPAPVEVRLNDRTLRAHPWPGASDGPVVLVFE